MLGRMLSTAAPSMLSDSTVRMMTVPTGTMSQGSIEIWADASWVICPQLGFSGEKPERQKGQGVDEQEHTAVHEEALHDERPGDVGQDVAQQNASGRDRRYARRVDVQQVSRGLRAGAHQANDSRAAQDAEHDRA